MTIAKQAEISQLSQAQKPDIDSHTSDVGQPLAKSESQESPEAAVDLGIVIVSWNTRTLLKKCLESLFVGQDETTLRVCVVDNASVDGSPEMVEESFPQIHLIRSGANLGYPKANNVGLRWLGFNHNDRVGPGDETPIQTESEKASGSVQPRYGLLLNPDTEVPPGALQQMVAFMDERPSVGVAGPCLRRLDGTIDKACRRSFPTPLVSFYRQVGLSRLFPKSRTFNAYNMEYLPEDAVHRVDAVVGAYMQVRAEALNEVGLLDESFFMYGEDLDWAKRFSDMGWEVWYNGSVEVLHVKEAASSQSIKSRIDFHEANWIFYNKHYRKQSSGISNALIRLGIVLFGGLDVAKHLWRYSSGSKERQR